MASPALREGHVWTDRRCNQFQQLEELLRDCQSIDSANGIIDRLKRIGEVAKELATSKLGEPSFVQFVKDQAMKDRFPEQIA